MKHTFTFLFLLFATIAFAQNSQDNMDWQYALRFGGDAKDYNGFLLNYPHHLALDNEGNAYVYGTNGHSATYYNNYSPQGQVLFDRFEYGSFYNCSSFLAKFDCNGNVVVNKAIGNYSNYDSPAQYMIMKDNRLFLLGVVKMPVRDQNVWFLDTLVYGNLLLNTYISHPEDLVFPWTPNNDYTYLLELDLDGNIVDYNMFSIYKENTLPYYGNILSKNYDMYTTDRKNVLPFAIDNQYNYYMLAQMRCNGPYDSLGNQIPQKMVFKHNDEAITDTIMPEDSKYIFRILKFDHDFDLQYAKPLVVNISDTAYHGLDMYFSDMTCDSDNNLYIAGTINLTYEHGVEPTLPIDVELADNKHLYITNPEYISDSEWSNPIFNSSFIMKMNSDGEILWIDYTKNYGPFGQSDFKSMLIDETSGNIYISALVTPKLWTSLSSSVYTNPYNGYNWTIFGENDTVINNRNYPF